MAHFAQLDSNNTVTQVIVINDSDTALMDGTETESIGVAYCQKLFGANTVWKQTSYNAKGSGFRGNFAGIGMTYMENVATLGVGSTDIFMPNKPFDSWVLNTTTASWQSPLGNPPSNSDPSKIYVWDNTAYINDNSTGWVLMANPQA
tara:strand:+ start:320 stop:760 length:441 start_codon:yes stop_codon:yes gene_type:complete